jgi:hypothetical protein
MMTRALTAGLVVLLLFAPRLGAAADIVDLAWTESNLDVLRTFDKAAVEDFVNSMQDDGMHAAVGEFAWIDLAGDKRYALVTRQDLSGRAYFDYLAIYWRSPSGKVTRDWIEGAELPSLDKIVRDLDGDGRHELVVPSAIDRHDPRSFATGWPSRVWPKVYKLQNGHYVDASRKYAKFYDGEVLPVLNSKIDEARDAVARDPEAQAPQRQLAAAQMSRDKILQLLGRPLSH